MRFMVILKGNERTERGEMPSRDAIEKMIAFNVEMHQAGVMLGAEGLYPSSKGKRVKFDGEKRSVTDGPFTEAKELVAGYWLIKANSLDEAIELVARAPIEGGEEMEVRQVIDPEDFGFDIPPEAT